MPLGPHVPAGVRSERGSDLQRPNACGIEAVPVSPGDELRVRRAEQRRLQRDYSAEAAEQRAKIQQLEWILDCGNGRAGDRRESAAYSATGINVPRSSRG